MRERLWDEYSTQTADAAQAKSPRRIQAVGGLSVSGRQAASTVLSAAASVGGRACGRHTRVRRRQGRVGAWPSLKRSPLTFAVICADQAVAVFVGTGVYHLLLETDGRRINRSLAVVRD